MRPSESFLPNRDLLHFVTCGDAGSGKSTLIGRIVQESTPLTQVPLTAVKTRATEYGTLADASGFALLLDEGAAEVHKASDIDVGYQAFATNTRRFIAADTPGHEHDTHKLVAAASAADAAILLVDARRGILKQARRHACLASLLGIRHAVLAVNKMELVDYDRNFFDQASEAFREMAKRFGFETAAAIPLSALKGDNVAQRSAHMAWYSGPTLMDCLETIRIVPRTSDKLVFPVQEVSRSDAPLRELSGSVAEGRVRVGDEIRITASGHTAKVAGIITADGALDEAAAGDAVTLKVDREIEASRGDIASLSQRPLETTDQFEATVVWLHEEPGLMGRDYDIRLSTQWASASVTAIKHRLDIDTLLHEASTKLSLDDISVCTLATSQPLVFDHYENSRTLGSFILVDRFSHATVAAGLIRHSLRRAQNVHRQLLSITRADREKSNGHRGKVIWFTGLSGSGKSTIANALEIELHSQGRRTYILDGDNVRHGLNKDLGFTDADRVENIRRVAEVAKLMMDAGLIVMTSFISPFRQERDMARNLIGPENFIEVHVSTPLDTCEQRDPKGLYKKARAGQLPNMTGIGSAYEPPEEADFTLDSSIMSVQESVASLMKAFSISVPY
jgi:bifunctional enzyme CysN/CysC